MEWYYFYSHRNRSLWKKQLLKKVLFSFYFWWSCWSFLLLKEIPERSFVSIQKTRRWWNLLQRTFWPRINPWAQLLKIKSQMTRIKRFHGLIKRISSIDDFKETLLSPSFQIPTRIIMIFHDYQDSGLKDYLDWWFQRNPALSLIPTRIMRFPGLPRFRIKRISLIDNFIV